MPAWWNCSDARPSCRRAGWPSVTRSVRHDAARPVLLALMGMPLAVMPVPPPQLKARRVPPSPVRRWPTGVRRAHQEATARHVGPGPKLALARRVPTAHHGPVRVRRVSVVRDHRALNPTTAHRVRHARTCRADLIAGPGHLGRPQQPVGRGPSGHHAPSFRQIVRSQSARPPSTRQRPLRPPLRLPPNNPPRTKLAAAVPRCCGPLNQPPSLLPTSAH